MNYIRTFFLLSIILFTYSIGQSNFGFKFGPNVSNFQNKEKGGSGGYNSVGIFYDFKIYNEFLLSVELTWLRKRLYLKQLSSFGENHRPGDTFYARDYRWDIHGIGIPLLLKYNFKLHKHISIQPYIGFTWSIEHVGNNSYYPRTPAGIVGEDKPDAIRKSEASNTFVNNYLDVGVSLKYRFVYLEFRYSHGIVNDVSIESFTDFYFDINTFHIFFGISLSEISELMI